VGKRSPRSQPACSMSSPQTLGLPSANGGRSQCMGCLRIATLHHSLSASLVAHTLCPLSSSLHPPPHQAQAPVLYRDVSAGLAKSCQNRRRGMVVEAFARLVAGPCWGGESRYIRLVPLTPTIRSQQTSAQPSSNGITTPTYSLLVFHPREPCLRSLCVAHFANNGKLRSTPHCGDSEIRSELPHGSGRYRTLRLEEIDTGDTSTYIIERCPIFCLYASPSLLRQTRPSHGCMGVEQSKHSATPTDWLFGHVRSGANKNEFQHLTEFLQEEFRICASFGCWT
jgi:hypothetical protein